MIRILGRASSINVQKVMWLAAEIDVAVERVDVGGKFGGNDTPEYLAKNPNGLVPTMEDGDFVLWESHAIMRYIADKAGAGPWIPADAEARYRADQWMDWYLTRLHPLMTTIFVQLIRIKPEDRDADAFAKAVELAAKLWRMVDDQLDGHPYLLGDAPGFADVPVGCSVHRWHVLDVARPKLGRIAAYWERLKERPAYQEHVVSARME